MGGQQEKLWKHTQAKGKLCFHSCFEFSQMVTTAAITYGNEVKKFDFSCETHVNTQKYATVIKKIVHISTEGVGARECTHGILFIL